MKRLHVHVSVADLAQSVRFYSALFAAEPAVLKPDYAKWMLDDPRVNFAISTRAEAKGLDHLGIQVDSPDELREVYQRLEQADRPVLEEGATTCCYAKSEKAWISDPQGLAWETFFTTGESTTYGHGIDIEKVRTAGAPADGAAESACCGAKPKLEPKQESACCSPGAKP